MSLGAANTNRPGKWVHFCSCPAPVLTKHKLAVLTKPSSLSFTLPCHLLPKCLQCTAVLPGAYQVRNTMVCVLVWETSRGWEAWTFQELELSILLEPNEKVHSLNLFLSHMIKRFMAWPTPSMFSFLPQITQPE